MGKKGTKNKPKTFGEQLASFFDRNKNLRADNPNAFTQKGEESIADKINFGGSRKKSKKKNNRKKY